MGDGSREVVVWFLKKQTLNQGFKLPWERSQEAVKGAGKGGREGKEANECLLSSD